MILSKIRTCRHDRLQVHREPNRRASFQSTSAQCRVVISDDGDFVCSAEVKLNCSSSRLRAWHEDSRPMLIISLFFPSIMVRFHGLMFRRSHSTKSHRSRLLLISPRSDFLITLHENTTRTRPRATPPACYAPRSHASTAAVPRKSNPDPSLLIAPLVA